MPKMKTKSGVKKRFKITGTRKVMAGQAWEASRHDQAEPKNLLQRPRRIPCCSRVTWGYQKVCAMGLTLRCTGKLDLGD